MKLSVIDDPAHDSRLGASADRLADLIMSQAQSLARFPKERMNEDMVCYDLLLLTAFTVLARLCRFEGPTCQTMINQVADELRVMLEESAGSFVNG